MSLGNQVIPDVSGVFFPSTTCASDAATRAAEHAATTSKPTALTASTNAVAARRSVRRPDVARTKWQPIVRHKSVIMTRLMRSEPAGRQIS